MPNRADTICCTNTASSSACTRKRLIYAPQPSMRFQCKQKQYHGVLACLSFLLPLLDDYVCLGGCAQEMACAQYTEDEDSLAALCHSFSRTAIGAPCSLQHHGPLSLQQLHTCADLKEASVSAFFVHLSERWYATICSRLSLCTLTGNGPLFSGRSTLHQELWFTPSGIVDRYLHHLCEARAVRAKDTVDLLRPNYLKEAGLCARRVFCESDPSSVVDVATSTAHGKWEALIDRYALCLPDRSHVHELENLPQEIAIGELLADCIQEISLSSPSEPPFRLQCVVDVGGGNGFLAAQVGERLGCDSVVIDPFFPFHAIDACPRRWPCTTQRVRPAEARRQILRRHVGCAHEINWDAQVALPPAECALITKHLCGTAVDDCLRRLDEDDRLPRILLLVPCCFHKGRYDRYVHQRFLQRALHIASEEAFDRLTWLTSWAHFKGNGIESLQRGVSSSAPKSMKRLIPSMEAIGRGVEVMMNCGRALWLQDRGYHTQVVEYVPSCVTPKNCCILAVRRSSRRTRNGRICV